MGFLVDTQKEGGGHSWGYLRSLVRRKQVDSADEPHSHHHHQLAKALTVPHLIAIGYFFLSKSFFFLEETCQVLGLGFFSSRLILLDFAIILYVMFVLYF